MSDTRVVKEEAELARAITHYLSLVDVLIEVLQSNHVLGKRNEFMPARTSRTQIA